MEEEEEAYTGGKASMKWDSPIVGAWEWLENGRKGERERYLLLLSFLFLFLGIIPLSVFDLFEHVSEPFVFVFQCFGVLSVCVFCVLASSAAPALFSPQPCLSTVATFCKVWSQSFTRRLSTTSRAPIGVKWQLEAIHNNTYIVQIFNISKLSFDGTLNQIAKPW